MRPFFAVPLLALAACAAPPATVGPTPDAPSAANAAERHREVQWFRTAAEYRALALQVFRDAWDAVREQTAGREPGTWAVILDADETVLDNSEFERRIAESGEVFEEEMWSEWVREEAATAVPGARRFMSDVQDAGGRVAIVTNRDEALCPATRRNLSALGIEPAVVLCETETGEKEPRFRMVQRGTAAPGLPSLDVIAWVGDNIGDFPDLDQSIRDAPEATFRLFGRRYFVLPNPMYGSWMGNEWR